MRGLYFKKACIAYGLLLALKQYWCKIHQSRGKADKSTWVDGSRVMTNKSHLYSVDN